MKRVLLSIAILTLLPLSWLQAGTGSQSGNRLNSESKRIIDDFAERLQKDVTSDNIGSISAAIFIGDSIVWSKAFGKANRENFATADTGTVYRAASITKTITAYLMMLLVQNGSINLDDPVVKYLPEIKNILQNSLLKSNLITFRHLASHTSGLAEEPELSSTSSGQIEQWEEKTLQSIPQTKLESNPGEKFSYSNIGYAILGLALSRAVNRPYIELVTEMVFNPLQMKNSFFIIPKGYENNVAVGYRWGAFTGEVDAEKAKNEHKGRGYRVPNGGIYTTPNDMACFLMAQCNSTANPLLPEHISDMQSIQTPESNNFGYGLGYYIRNNDKGITMVEHDGGVAGYNAFMVFNPESRIGVILMRNYSFGLTNILLLPRTVLSELVEAEKIK